MISFNDVLNFPVSQFLVSQTDKGQRFLGCPLSMPIKCVPHTLGQLEIGLSKIVKV